MELYLYSSIRLHGVVLIHNKNFITATVVVTLTTFTKGGSGFTYAFILIFISHKADNSVPVALTEYICKYIRTHIHIYLNMCLHNLLLYISVFLLTALHFKGLYKIKWDPFLTRTVFTIGDSVLIQLKLNWVLINCR